LLANRLLRKSKSLELSKINVNFDATWPARCGKPPLAREMPEMPAARV
jgi:hypothetical protein